MDRSLTLGTLAFALTLALATPQVHADTKPAPTASPAAAASAADTPSKTPHNATFVLPAGWSQKAEGAAMILTPPEADGSRIAIMDSSAKTADEAVEEGWKLLKLSPKFLVANDAAPKDGWEQRRFYDYDVPANAKRAVFAGAFRRGAKFTVLVADVDQAIAEKRASQFGKIQQRLQPADYKRETFKGRTAHKFDDARLKQVADFVEHMRSEYDVPGVAIGIVQDGKVVMAQGFGVRALGKPEKGSGLNGILDDTGTTQVAASLNNYINGFSPNVRSIMERFGFGEQIARMAEKDLLYLVIKKFANVDLSPERVDPVQMGYVFEELIRIGTEQPNEEPGNIAPRVRSSASK